MFIKNLVEIEFKASKFVFSPVIYDLRVLRLYGQEEKRKRWMPWQ